MNWGGFLIQTTPKIVITSLPVTCQPILTETTMDFDTFDTDIWSEIQDAPGEIFDIPEMSDERFNVEEHINGNTEF